ncbi:SusC/RagA family TonB-linked outer membrane protein [Parafilimonas sp.]|uniref:SusC/RagA family TonB-linked outer membrane protein n=1 Tax=Parafilimonas sp. TaxID=1969739 RepID=UPI0039E547DC
MTLNRLLKALVLCPTLLLLAFAARSQKTVTGKITDEKGSPITGASIVVKGGKTGTTTDASGNFVLNVPSTATSLTVSFVGFTPQDVDISSSSSVNVSLAPDNSSLTDVVVIGYGTAKKKDLSGSYSTVTAKNFNKIPSTTPDQLLQGKVAGLQVTVASGAPGAPASVKIRGNNSIRSGTDPLYVVDGVPLDGRSARPGFISSVSGLGTMPDANPLTYLNPGDIQDISVLKDASASAIYGSRGANGVVMITTKTGAAGPARFDVGTSWSIGGLMKQPDVLNASEYRTALAKYGASSDSGASINPFDAIIQHKLSQNYSVAFNGGGSENSRFRASFFASKFPGLVDKTALNKYIGNINGSYKFLDNKLTLKFGLTAANTKEQIAPISNDAGSTGNLVSLAMQWNPTLLLQRSATDYTVNPNGQINPALLSRAYNDYAVVTTLLGNISAGYKIFPSLEYMFFYGVNYSSGTRGQELQGYITGTGGNADGAGLANTASAQLFSQTITHTLTFTKDFNDVSLTALAGYEYYATKYKWQASSVYQFDYNLDITDLVPIHYYDNMQDGEQANLTTSSSNDPTTELQSYFGRVQLGYKNKYIITASFRADGSTKFGKNNRYGYFPAVSGKWSVSDEGFMKNSKVFNNLALRVGWGRTGNQSFPSGSSQDRYQYTSYGSLSVVNFANPDLKWETVSSTNGGIDFGFLNNRLTGSIDVFFKKTTDPLFPGTLAAPANSGIIWQNLAGYVTNKGGEIGLNWQIIQGKNFSWSISPTATYVVNKFVYPEAGSGPMVLTGNLNGKGTSATYVQAIANGQPVDVFYLRKFYGFDKDGFSITDDSATYNGDPNPRWIVGFGTELDYKKWSLVINMHGAFNYVIYNNTLQSVTGLSFITNGSNISKTLINTTESVANPVSASTRYLYSGNYMKMGNVTLSYRMGDIGKVIKNASVYFTGVNLFSITKYPGFDPEVNVSKADINSTGIPSIGIDYVGYPTVRSFTLGINLSLGN